MPFRSRGASWRPAPSVAQCAALERIRSRIGAWAAWLLRGLQRLAAGWGAPPSNSALCTSSSTSSSPSPTPW
eukprot:7189137-Lingulodinium_polyedra.AAC.1